MEKALQFYFQFLLYFNWYFIEQRNYFRKLHLYFRQMMKNIDEKITNNWIFSNLFDWRSVHWRTISHFFQLFWKKNQLSYPLKWNFKNLAVAIFFVYFIFFRTFFFLWWQIKIFYILRIESLSFKAEIVVKNVVQKIIFFQFFSEFLHWYRWLSHCNRFL